MDLCTNIKNAWDKHQSVQNRGINCTKLHHKVRLLCHQEIVVESRCHYVMVFSTDPSHMCLLYAQMSFHDVRCF